MKKSRNEMIVGLFVIVGFVMLSLVVFFVSGVYLFRSGYSVVVMYDYVDIMDKGAPIRMAGVRIGEVNKVDLVFDEQTRKTRVKVTTFLDSKIQIRENYEFEIRGTHVLSEPHIEITPVEGDAPLLKDGAVVEGKKLVPIEDLIKNAHHVSEGLDQIINGKINDSDGDMKKAILQLKSSTDNLNTILTKINTGEGTVGKLVSNDELYQDVRGLVHEIKAHPWRLLKKDDKYDNVQTPGSAPAPEPKKKRFLFF